MLCARRKVIAPTDIMNKGARIYVAGHRGLAGSAILRRLQALGYERPITRARRELDLTDQQAVRDFFAEQKPEYVFLAAAKVGGIHANDAYPADFIRSNLDIQTHVIDSGTAAAFPSWCFWDRRASIPGTRHSRCRKTVC